ncbi:MAG: tRNA pseudouridine(38-40) synthase TruA [Pyrinomonadaceae bacterium]
MNYRLLIQYEGTDFHGWQIQANNQRTVQGELTRVLSMLEGAAVTVHGSGRTDAGAHAEAQVANVHLERPFTPDKLLIAINGNLPRDIRIMNVETAAPDFHARFSAKGKTYRYRVLNASVMSPFWRRYALHEPRPLDLAKMQCAARLFFGVHDWTAFSAARSDAENRVREVTRLDIEKFTETRMNAELIEFTISAEGFLRYMARSIVGTLLEVGRGEKTSETVWQAIVTGERRLAKETAAAHGLTLLKVHYD